MPNPNEKSLKDKIDLIKNATISISPFYDFLVKSTTENDVDHFRLAGSEICDVLETCENLLEDDETLYLNNFENFDFEKLNQINYCLMCGETIFALLLQRKIEREE